MPALLFLFLTAALYTDMKEQKIPNRLTLPAIAVGIAVQTAAGGWRDGAAAAVSAGVGFLLTFVLYLCRAVGAGDVKLFAAIGSLSGVTFILESLSYAVFIAGGIAACMLIIRSNRAAVIWSICIGAVRLLQLHDISVFRQLQPSLMTRFPFMLAVFPAVLCAWWR